MPYVLPHIGGSSKSCRNHEEWINSCRLPNVNNFLAKENKITNATTNDATCITISWEFEGGNGTQWCDNVEFKLFITHWNSVQETPDSDFSSAETSSKEFSWILLHKAPLTSQSHFQTCQIDLKRYYEFRIQLKDLTTSQTANVYSHVYYFGLQGIMLLRILIAYSFNFVYIFLYMYIALVNH